MPRKSLAPRGFTLIELLVVIAIIAILAAILFPVFSKARENARKATCLSHAKQIGLALMMYVQDYDERYPGRWTGWVDPPITPRRAYIGWRTLIYPYVKSADVFRCPSNPNKAGLAAADVYDRYHQPPLGTNYACNGDSRDIGGNAAMPAPVGVLMATVERPAELIFVAENKNPRLEICLRCNTRSGNTITDTEAFGGHSAMANFIFGDGHAKTMKWTMTGTPQTNMWAINEQGKPAPPSLLQCLGEIQSYWDNR